MKSPYLHVFVVAVVHTLGVAGCVPVDAVSDATAGQDNPGLDDDSWIIPGTYSGTISCEQRESQFGIYDFETADSFLRTVTFAESGLPVRDGEEVFRGQVTVEGAGADVRTYTVRTIVLSDNAAVVNEDARWEICRCELGTNCGSDCTSVVLTGFGSISYQYLDERRVRYASLETLADEVAGSITVSVQCDGVLSR